MNQQGYESQGIQGKCIKLNRANGEYVRVPFIIFYSLDDRYFTFWYYPTDSVLETLFSHYSAGSTGPGGDGSGENWYRLYKDTSNGLQFEYEHAVGVLNTITLGTVNLNQWNLICIGSDSRAIARGSLNGAAYVSTATATTANAPINILSFLGGECAKPAPAANLISYEAVSNFCDSYFDNFVGYNIQPTTAQLLDIFKDGKGKRSSRAPLYKTNGLTHVTFDNLSVVDHLNGGIYKFYANIFSSDYLNPSICYTDGVNDNIAGLNGVNGFNISRFQAAGDISMNMIIDFKSPITKDSVVCYLWAWLTAANAVVLQGTLGNSTTATADEFININKGSAGTIRSVQEIVANETLFGFYMITVTVGSTNNIRIYIDAVRRDSTGAGTTSNSLSTATKLFLANRNGTNYVDVGIKELAIWKGKELTGAEVTDIYDYYTSSGSIALANSTVSLESNSTYFSDAALIELWKGDVVSEELVATKRPKATYPTDHHNLTITGRITTPGSSSNFYRRRGKTITV